MSGLARRGDDDGRDRGWRDAGRGSGGRRAALLASAILAAAGVVGTARAAAQHRDDGAPRGVPTVVVARTVEPGSRGDRLAAALEVRDVAPAGRPRDAIDDLAAVGSAPLNREVVAGQVLRRADLGALAGTPRQGVGTVPLPPGSVEVSVSLPVERALGGRVRAGSKVLVVGTGEGETAPTGLVAGPVTVTRVDQDDTTSGKGTVGVTLSVTGADLVKVVPAAASGSVWLAGVPR